MWFYSTIDLLTKQSFMQIILASTSPYRKLLLEKIIPEFECVAPDIDETPAVEEPAERLAYRLAKAKAQAVAQQQNGKNSLVIGSDQVAAVDDVILGKPGTIERATEQLTMCSGKKVTFYTGLCLVNTGTRKTSTVVETFSVVFRELTLTQIVNYVNRELPLNCAGSFKSEGLGVALFESMEGKDPNTLIGLPLIELTRLLETNGYDVLAS